MYINTHSIKYPCKWQRLYIKSHNHKWGNSTDGLFHRHTCVGGGHMFVSDHMAVMVKVVGIMYITPSNYISLFVYWPFSISRPLFPNIFIICAWRNYTMLKEESRESGHMSVVMIEHVKHGRKHANSLLWMRDFIDWGTQAKCMQLFH